MFELKWQVIIMWEYTGIDYVDFAGWIYNKYRYELWTYIILFNYCTKYYRLAGYLQI